MNIRAWKPSIKNAQAVINFVLHPLPLEDVTKLLHIRRSRALSRSLGLQSMQSLLRNASYPTMKHEALCFLGPALKSSGLVKRSWPYHYLDDLPVITII